MEERFRIQLLQEEYLGLRGTFASDEGALDVYLRERARKEVQQRIAAVWIAHDEHENRIAGYYTLSAIAIQRSALPPAFTHRMAQYEVYPATLIGRLAVDQTYRRQRIGERLLLDALARARAASREVASVAVVTDTKNETVQEFYERYGFILLPAERYERRLFLPMATIEKLFS